MFLPTLRKSFGDALLAAIGKGKRVPFVCAKSTFVKMFVEVYGEVPLEHPEFQTFVQRFSRNYRKPMTFRGGFRKYRSLGYVPLEIT